MMPIFDPKDLALWGRAVWNKEPKNRIEGFSIDTRKLGQGQMFVALNSFFRLGGGGSGWNVFNSHGFDVDRW